MMIHVYAKKISLIFFAFLILSNITFSNDEINNEENELAVIRNLDFTDLYQSEISLSEAIQKALLFQPKIRIAKIDLDKAIESKRATDNYWHPTIDLNYTNRIDSSLDDRTSPNSEKVESYALSLRQDLNFIRTRIQKRIGDNSVSSAIISDYLESQNIALGIAILYVESARNMELKNILRERQSILDIYYNILVKRFEIGVASELELKRIGVAIKRSRSEEAFIERRLQDSLSILASSIGVNQINVNQLLAFDRDIKTINNPDVMLDEALNRNLILKLAKNNLKNSIEQKREAHWQLFPDVSAQLSKTYDEYREGDNGTNTTAEIKVGFNLWDGLSRRTNYNKSKLEINLNEELIKDVILEIKIDHDKFIGIRETAFKEFLFAKDAQDEAMRLLDLQKISFERGEGTTTNEIVSAVQEWSDSTTRVRNSMHDVIIQDFQLMNLTSELCEKYC